MIIGTAGHIDHGKSTLIAALTRRPMDRLQEEQRRGITIELNFAPLELEGLPPVGIVDVPGHEDFVRTMVAGATGIDLVLLVVDAVEGIRPQTLEHLAIVEQLGIPEGIPVITKIDLANPDWIDLVDADLQDRLQQSPVRFSEPVRVSPVTGEGLETLRMAIRSRAEIANSTPDTSSSGDLLRLPIDRAFAVAGVGPVVTGTLWSGSVRVGDQVTIQPGARSARVRSVESFGKAVPAAVPGTRTAVGLSGVELTELKRGQVVLGIDSWKPTSLIDTSVALLASAPRPLTTRTRIRVHHGTAEVIARVYPRSNIHPGSSGPARIVLEAPLVVRGGDRFVLRSYSPVTTIGGGWVADPEPPRRAAWSPELVAAEPERRLQGLLIRRPTGVPVEDLLRLLGRDGADAVSGPGLVQVAGYLVPREKIETARQDLIDRLQRFHRRDPVAPGLSLETLRAGLGPLAKLADHLLNDLMREGLIRRQSDGTASLATHKPSSAGGEPEVEAVVAAVRSAGLEGPLGSELAGRLSLRDLSGALRLAVARGWIEAVDRDRYVARESLERLEGVLRDVGKGDVEISPGAVRDRLGLSRKHLIPLLEWADRRGITWRDREGVRRLKK